MNKITNYTSLGFILVVALMTAIALLGVWEVFTEDAIEKSFQTVGFLAIVCVVVYIGSRFMGPESQNPIAAATPWSMFASIRKLTVSVLVISVALLALMGVMAIWELLSNDVFWRAFSSIILIALSSVLIAGVCLARENNPLLVKALGGGNGSRFSWGRIVVILLVLFIGVPFMLSMFSAIFW